MRKIDGWFVILKFERANWISSQSRRNRGRGRGGGGGSFTIFWQKFSRRKNLFYLNGLLLFLLPQYFQTFLRPWLMVSEWQRATIFNKAPKYLYLISISPSQLGFEVVCLLGQVFFSEMLRVVSTTVTPFKYIRSSNIGILGEKKSFNGDKGLIQFSC